MPPFAVQGRDYKDREYFGHATRGGIKLETFLHVPILTSVSGGLVAFVGGLLAQISSNDAVANTGLWVSLAGITASLAGLITGITKAWFDENQKKREHDLTRLKFEEERDRMAAEREVARVKMTLDAENAKKANANNKARIDAIRQWAHDVKAKFPGVPDPPGFDVTTGDILIVTPDPDHINTV